jgi:hypothetical protein
LEAQPPCAVAKIISDFHFLFPFLLLIKFYCYLFGLINYLLLLLLFLYLLLLLLI